MKRAQLAIACFVVPSLIGFACVVENNAPPPQDPTTVSTVPPAGTTTTTTATAVATATPVPSSTPTSNPNPFPTTTPTATSPSP